jgi:DNA repair protein SbcD/Mre11
LPLWPFVKRVVIGGRRYAPCTVDDLRRFGYDYWALGHIHAAEIVSRDPWIVFPGNLQGRSVRETGAKGAVRVTVEDGLSENSPTRWR